MIKSIPLNKLIQSPRNVRRHSDPAADAELKASIAAHGLLQNLIVRPAAKGKFEVEAGERRRRAMLALVNEKIFARDHEVTCLVLEDNAEAAVETSLAENFHRLAMLGHVSEVSFDERSETLPCLFQAARSAYPKSWRRAAWNKHLRQSRGQIRRQHGCHAGAV
ncbi:chromosome partitioning protein ParB [Sphingobium fuliginis]|uniref:Chromosome partitioning protein ParB n=1 Tax=Sphingobium fuliginis (strain ATCC 27551) TaxID=336203 RepID=A0A292ZBG7_SPHSA|nr:chromosome partitioning protein ParB [Sphingobium fuliginis]